ncbi:hypothetical protein Tco_0223532 [Tanacetum coccineum]
MLAPKGSTFNGRPTFANPMYLKKAQSEKQCLYEISYDISDLANRFVLDREETLTLEKEKLVDQAWEKHSHEHFRAPNAHDMEILIKTCLMPLALKTQNDTFKFVHEPKQEMHVDLKYIESLKKEIDELKYDKAEFSNMYDLLLQECVSNDVMCSYLHSLSDFDAYNELQSQLQDKNIAISELKKLIEEIKGKGVDTNFKKQSILKKLPLQPIRNQPVKKDAQSHKTTKGYMLAEKKYDSKKHDKQIPIGQKFSPNKSFVVYMKTTPPRSGLIVKPMGRIFTQVGLKWIPIRKPVETRYNMNDSASPLGKETHNPKTVIWANSSSLSAGTSMASEPISSKGSSNVNILSSSLYKHSIFNYVRKYF